MHKCTIIHAVSLVLGRVFTCKQPHTSAHLLHTGEQWGGSDVKAFLCWCQRKNVCGDYIVVFQDRTLKHTKRFEHKTGTMTLALLSSHQTFLLDHCGNFWSSENYDFLQRLKCVVCVVLLMFPCSLSHSNNLDTFITDSVFHAFSTKWCQI